MKSSRVGGSITSYSYNLPNQIDYNGNSSQFSYDASHQRWKQIANYAGTVETTHYVGPALQIVTRGSVTEYRHLIPAGSSSAVYTRRTDGTTGTYYATSDHLGSADLVLDSAANVLTRESFTPFGARRGSNWQGLPSTADYGAFASTTRKGFTGHEMLDAVSLVHMNGRVYDPYLGRFLTPDSLIQSLAASQSINPFAYAWNNPLRYVDPSGHSLLGDIIGLIVTIAIIVFAPELGLPAIGTAEGIGTAVVAGFVGGFVGAAVSTGSLAAALEGGVIGALTAAAFFQAGSFADWAGKTGGAEWKIVAGLASHAAVGCGSAALSGGNCGKGALAAAISEAAVDGHLVKADAVGVWGTAEGAAEAGLVGGVAAEVEGGKFTDGFSVGAAGYLFNELAHRYGELARFTQAKATIDAIDADNSLSSEQKYQLLSSAYSQLTSLITAMRFSASPDLYNQMTNDLGELSVAMLREVSAMGIEQLRDISFSEIADNMIESGGYIVGEMGSIGGEPGENMASIGWGAKDVMRAILGIPSAPTLTISVGIHDTGKGLLVEYDQFVR